jgi:hypothetical protein
MPYFAAIVIDEMQSIEIPDIEGYVNVVVGNISYSMTNIKAQSLDIPLEDT